MKQTFVQCAEVLLEPGSDAAAPGGAVTLALCGSWDHAGSCRWPHETAARWEGEGGRRGRVRVVFVAPQEEEELVRGLIDRALAGGRCTGPDGIVSRWGVAQQGEGEIEENERTWGDAFVGESNAG